ncbi:bifunctional adenosylcobinamide kinase/adenosylcobinamide-phosphate guanylyltransferase [Corynebacterium sp. H128]|uniref:bifunctional adenosylcobinamide kinase/adenosylcobinamide-phosphate guanylyltransferase n=1 Tax=unclassified Corynebacterium TaxID=2624378 RepID=UPI003099EC2F
MLTLVLGGARSGKSAWAEALFPTDAQVCYIATARPYPGDTDFAARIKEHQDRRPAHWVTEDELELCQALQAGHEHVLIDDLGTWLTHRIDAATAWELPRGTVTPDVDKLLGVLTETQNNVVVVTPEVGLGVIPETAAGRLFRDELGRLNARVAELADKVVLVVAGIPLTLKSDS